MFTHLHVTLVIGMLVTISATMLLTQANKAYLNEHVKDEALANILVLLSAVGWSVIFTWLVAYATGSLHSGHDLAWVVIFGWLAGYAAAGHFDLLVNVLAALGLNPALLLAASKKDGTIHS